MLTVAIVVALVGAVVGTAALMTTTKPATKLCVYSREEISVLNTFGEAIGRPLTCALVYNDTAANWSSWEKPWFTDVSSADLNWAAWVRSQHGRTLIDTQSVVPAGVPADWRARGAAGQYDAYAVTLARNLVAAGLGSAIIRLSPEANGDIKIGNVGTTPEDYANWSAYWARIVRAMRSVPGANFRFDWTVNAGYRPIPFASYYPGDDVVNIIGIDAYDFTVGNPATPDQRWANQYNQPGGLASLIAFAHAHNKPLSIPEWGLVAPSGEGAGDNPRYIDGIADIVAKNHVLYQSYFFSTNGGVGMLLTDAPQSFAEYKVRFVGG
jgi:beta-mannanase